MQTINLFFYLSLFLLVMAGDYIAAHSKQTYYNMLHRFCYYGSTRIAMRTTMSLVLLAFCVVNLRMGSLLTTFPALVLGSTLLIERVSDIVSGIQRKYTNIIFIACILLIASVYMAADILSWRVILLYGLMDAYSKYYLDNETYQRITNQERK